MGIRARLGDERLWALIGKVAAFIATTVAIALGGLNIADKTTGPSLVASVEETEIPISPELQDVIGEGISREVLTSLVKANLKPGDLMKRVSELADPKSLDSELQRSLADMKVALLNGTKTWTFTIVNSGQNLAKSTRLVLAGSGRALIVEDSTKGDAKPIAWSGDVPIGDVRPNVVVTVHVWPKGILAPSVVAINPILVHETGSGKVFNVQQFYGWDADWVAWFLAQSRALRIAMWTFFVAVASSAVWLGFHRGHLVLRPRPPEWGGAADSSSIQSREPTP